MSALNDPRATTLDVAELLLPQGPRPVDFASPSARPDFLLTGRLEAFDEAGRPLVKWDRAPDNLLQPAHATISLGQADLGREVILSTVLVSGQLQPVILGLLQKPMPIPATESAPEEYDVSYDGKRLIISAEEDITLCCGKSSITLTKAGKILLRGDYIASRSSGVNRIKGASVQIN
jgi:hypothetical protein